MYSPFIPVDSEEKRDKTSSLLSIYDEFHSEICAQSGDKLSPWILQFHFNNEMMMRKNIRMSDVHFMIMKKQKKADTLY